MNTRNIQYLLLIFSIFTLGQNHLFSQKKILVYHETNGFRHSSAITNGITMFEDLGNINGEWTADNTSDSSVFNMADLSQYNAVVFLNTSGNNLLTDSEKTAFENFIKSGMGFIGIHAATDTYRDKSWDFYNELVGAIVQTSPNHTANNFNADLEVKADHPIVSFLSDAPPVVGSIWNKNEEYYYWEQNGGQLSADNVVLLEVESTGSQSYGAARPMTWYKESITYDNDGSNSTAKVTINNIRAFYTALGHNGSDYSSNTKFRELLENAVLWAIGNTLSFEAPNTNNTTIYPNPASNYIKVKSSKINSVSEISIFDVTGKAVYYSKNNTIKHQFKIDISSLSKGFYILHLEEGKNTRSLRFLKT